MKLSTQPTLIPAEKSCSGVPHRVEVAAEEGLMGTYLDTILANGGLFTPTQAAKMIGVSTARVSELTRKKQLPLVEVAFMARGVGEFFTEHLIPGNAIQRWLAAPKSKGGRGHRAPAMQLVDVAA